MTHLSSPLPTLTTVLRALRRRAVGVGLATLVVVALPGPAAFSGAGDIFVQWLEASAARGDPDAQFLLALNRVQERGAPEALASAVEWYRGLGGRGDSRGRAVVGAMHLLGAGVPGDDAAAVKLLCEAAKQKSAEGQFVYAPVLDEGCAAPRNAAAQKWLRKAADAGRLGAAARRCAIGAPAVAENDAVKFCKSASVQGDGLASYRFGLACKAGRGVSQNHVEATRLVRLAAEAGDASAPAERDALAPRMKPEAVARARQLARDRAPKKP